MNEDKLITKVLPFEEFQPSEEQFFNYYYDNPEKPFCKTYIRPKLEQILDKFPEKINADWSKLIE